MVYKARSKLLWSREKSMFWWEILLIFAANEFIMGSMASQITSLMIVYSTVYLGVDQRKHQSSASLAFVRGIHRWPVNSPQKGPVTRKCFHLMTSSCSEQSGITGSHVPDSVIDWISSDYFSILQLFKQYYNDRDMLSWRMEIATNEGDLFNPHVPSFWECLSRNLVHPWAFWQWG